LAALAIGGTVTAYARYRQSVFLGTFMLLSLCIGLVPLIMRAVYAILGTWMNHVPDFLPSDPQITADCRAWTEGEYWAFNNSPSQWRFGLSFALLACWAWWAAGAFAQLSSPALVLALGITFLSTFVCGVGLISVYCLARHVWRVGKRYEVRVSDHQYGVLSTGSMLVKNYALVAVVWCVSTSSATWTLDSRGTPLFALAVPTAVFFVGSFLVCQFPLHARMVEYKRKRLKELDALLNRLAPDSPDDVTKNRQGQVEFCVSEIRRTSKLPEWPFGIGALSGVVGASIGTVAPQLLQTLIPMLLQTQVKTPP
jgi:hypothetical protein